MAYPRNIGWHPDFLEPTHAGSPLKLSDLTVHNVTNFLTHKLLKSKFPNCVKAWREHVPHIMRFSTIFKSFGTDLSDATEEKQWRKLVHRALNVKNRHPGTDHTCRMCKNDIESMLHIVTCRKIRAFWKACIQFTTSILGAPPPHSMFHAIIFGQWRRSDDPEPLGPEHARAFLRHAFGVFFHDFCNITHKKIRLKWESTYLRAVLSFKNAVLRRGQSFAVLYANRCYTTLPAEIPEEERKKYSRIITIEKGGNYRLTPLLTNEIERAKQLLNINPTDTHRPRRST